MIIITLVTVMACRQNSGSDSRQVPGTSQDDLVETNRILVRKDAEKIRAYVNRRNWKMLETETGLWYMILEESNGILAKEGYMATINFRISLLDGTVCYSSDIEDPKVFRIGQGGVESGLEEGILLMHEGDKARFIMPPHLAHGLLGDNNKIPPRAIILYDVELINLDEN